MVEKSFTDDQIRRWQHETNAIALGARAAAQDFRRHVIAELPDPKVYAFGLSAKVAEALLSARVDNDGFYLLPDQARVCIKFGLCEAGSQRKRYHLGNFGTAVLRELRRDWA